MCGSLDRNHEAGQGTTLQNEAHRKGALESANGRAFESSPKLPEIFGPSLRNMSGKGGRANWGTQKLETFGGEGLEVPQLVGDQAERVPDFGFACAQKYALESLRYR